MVNYSPLGGEMSTRGVAHGVAQPDVRLIAQPRPSEVGVGLASQPEHGRLGADRPDGNRVEGKLDAVVLHGETQEVAEEFGAKEQRALEDEVVAVRRTSEAVQEAFNSAKGRPPSRAAFLRRA